MEADEVMAHFYLDYDLSENGVFVYPEA